MQTLGITPYGSNWCQGQQMSHGRPASWCLDRSVQTKREEAEAVQCRDKERCRLCVSALSHFHGRCHPPTRRCSRESLPLAHYRTQTISRKHQTPTNKAPLSPACCSLIDVHFQASPCRPGFRRRGFLPLRTPDTPHTNKLNGTPQSNHRRIVRNQVFRFGEMYWIPLPHAFAFRLTFA